MYEGAEQSFFFTMRPDYLFDSPQLGGFPIEESDEPFYLGHVVGSEFLTPKGLTFDPYANLTFKVAIPGEPELVEGTLYVIPEPGTVVMLLGVAGALLLLVIRRRRRA